MDNQMYNRDTGTPMIAASVRRRPLLTTFLAILLAAPGFPISAAPIRDAAAALHAPRTVRENARDPTLVSVSMKGRDNQDLKRWVVTLFLVDRPGGPGLELVSNSGEKAPQVGFDADRVARFSGLRSNGVLGSFTLVAKVTGPDGDVVNVRKTVRNVRGFVFLGLSVKQLVSIAAGGAAVVGIVAATTSGDKTITPVPPGVVVPPVGPASRRPR